MHPYIRPRSLYLTVPEYSVCRSLIQPVPITVDHYTYSDISEGTTEVETVCRKTEKRIYEFSSMQFI